MIAYVQGSDTSYAAAISMRGSASSLRDQILDLVRETPRTCAEVEEITGMRHQTASARIKELADAKKIVDSGNKRPTPSGRNAIVWSAPTA